MKITSPLDEVCLKISSPLDDVYSEIDYPLTGVCLLKEKLCASQVNEGLDNLIANMFGKRK